VSAQRPGDVVDAALESSRRRRLIPVFTLSTSDPAKVDTARRLRDAMVRGEPIMLEGGITLQFIELDQVPDDRVVIQVLDR
jgi:hypothetical protein